MDYLRFLGLLLLLSYFLILSIFMLSDYKPWESQLLKLLKPIEALTPIIYTYIKEHTRCTIQTIGTIGILLSFFAVNGCKYSVRVLTLATLGYILLLNATTPYAKDLYADIGNLVKIFAITGGLLQVW